MEQQKTKTLYYLYTLYHAFPCHRELFLRISFVVRMHFLPMLMEFHSFEQFLSNILLNLLVQFYSTNTNKINQISYCLCWEILLFPYLILLSSNVRTKSVSFGDKNKMALPDLPALPVRPTRCT